MKRTLWECESGVISGLWRRHPPPFPLPPVKILSLNLLKLAEGSSWGSRYSQAAITLQCKDSVQKILAYSHQPLLLLLRLLLFSPCMSTQFHSRSLWQLLNNCSYIPHLTFMLTINDAERLKSLEAKTIINFPPARIKQKPHRAR